MVAFKLYSNIFEDNIPGRSFEYDFEHDILFILEINAFLPIPTSPIIIYFI